jgi:hypothetical protein
MIAAQQIVIVSDRRSPGAERSKSAKPTLQPSACVPQPDPTPIDALLQTKAKVQFDKTVNKTVEAFFLVQSLSNLAEC